MTEEAWIMRASTRLIASTTQEHDGDQDLAGDPGGGEGC